MANNKTLNSRIFLKNDIEANWDKAINFIPHNGEIIIYNAEKEEDLIPEGRKERYSFERIKIGNGIDNVKNLPFYSTSGQKTIEGGEIFNLYEDTEENIGSIGGINIGKQTFPKNQAGRYAHAEGISTIATSEGTHSEGFGTKADAKGAHAEGVGVLVTGISSHGEGRGVNFTVNVTAIDGNIITVKSNSSSIIQKTAEYEAIGKNALVWYETDSTNHNGEFYYVTAFELVKDFLGLTTTGCKLTLDRTPSFTTTGINLTMIMGGALSSMSHTEGNYCNAVNIEATNFYDDEGSDRQRQHAEGTRTLAIGYASHAEGDSTIASGSRGHAEGSGTVASGSFSHSQGKDTVASGFGSHAEGNGSTASGKVSHAEGTGTEAAGNNSHTEGNKTNASGENAHAEGNGSIASGTDAHAEGEGTQATSRNTHAEGKNTQATAYEAHAEGQGTTARSYYTHAEGYNTIAGGDTVEQGQAAHAEGSGTQATGDYSHAGGEYTFAKGRHSFTHGFRLNAIEQNQAVLGQCNTNNADALFIIGNGESPTARSNAFEVYKDGHAEVRTAGTSNNSVVIKSSLDQAISELIGSLGSGGLTRQIVDVLPDVANASENVIYMVRNNNEDEHNVYDEFMVISGAWEIIGSTAANLDDIPGKKTAEGGEIFNQYEPVYESENIYDDDGYLVTTTEVPYENTASTYAHAEGYGNTARGAASHAEGEKNIASGKSSHAEGCQTRATTYYSHSEGKSTIAEGSYSHSEGVNTKASGEASHSEGSGTTASAQASHSEGLSTQATARSAHAEGKDTIASAYEAHAEGQSTTARSYYTHAEGKGTVAGGDTPDKGQAAHAEGRGTTASGNFSHAGGEYTFAIGEGSFTHGFRLNAKQKNQTVIGQCNSDNANALFIVGNGDSPTARSNAFEVYKDGHAEVKAMGETDNSIATRKFVMDNAGGAGEAWELINDVTIDLDISEGETITVVLNEDLNKQAFRLKKAKLLIIVKPLKGIIADGEKEASYCYNFVYNLYQNDTLLQSMIQPQYPIYKPESYLTDFDGSLGYCKTPNNSIVLFDTNTVVTQYTIDFTDEQLRLVVLENANLILRLVGVRE